MSIEALSEADFQRALERTWWPVARSLDLSRPRQAQLLDHKLVVFRGRDGDARVADDRCPHRGASLAGGKAVGDAIQCPYHGWEWDGDSGRCTHIPSLGDQAQIPSTASVRTYAAQERWGLVWICLSDEPAGGIADPDWLSELDSVYDVRTSDVTANVLFVQENFRDVGHFAYVHADTIPVRSPVVAALEVHRDGFELRCEIAVPYARGERRIWDTGTETVMSYHAIAPGFASIMSRDRSGGARYLLNCPSPVSLERTRTFYVNGVTPGLAGDLPGMVAGEERVYAEDSRIVGDIEPRRLGEPLNQVHTIADTYTLAFRRAFLDYVMTYGKMTTG